MLTRAAEIAGVVSVLLPLIGLITQTAPSADAQSTSAAQDGNAVAAWLQRVHIGVQDWGSEQSATVVINWAVAAGLLVFLVSFIVIGLTGLLLDSGRADVKYAGKVFLRTFLWLVAISALFLWAFWNSLPIWAIWVGALGPLVLAFVAGRLGTMLLARYVRRLT